jgi:hypothetical protein
MLTSDRPVAAALKMTLKLVSSSYLRVIRPQKSQQKDINLFLIGGNDVDQWDPTETLRREAGWDSETPRILDHTDM